MQWKIGTVATLWGETRKNLAGCLGCCNALFLHQAAGYTSESTVYEKKSYTYNYVYFSVYTIGPCGRGGLTV